MIFIVLLSDAVETSQSLVKDVSQEALVSTFDEETQAAQDKKEEMNLPKDSPKETEEALTFVKDPSNQKSPKAAEKVTFKDIVQSSVTNENSDMKMDTDTKEVPKSLHTEKSCTQNDAAQSVKTSAKDDVADTSEEKQDVEKEGNSGKGVKRSLEEDKEGPEKCTETEEGSGKRPRKSESTVDSSPRLQEQKERQNTPQEEEAEPMETETTRDLEPESGIKIQKRMELEEVGKGDDGSRDGEGDEAGEEDVEKKDINGQEKEKDDSKEDEESSTPSRKRKKKKRSYERPRGEGGKFMKEKPGTVL